MKRIPPMHMRTAIRSATFVLVACLSVLPTVTRAQNTVSTSDRPGTKRTGGLKPPAEKELIYVCLPGTLEGSWDQNGNGIVVLDAADSYNFVKRIPTWDIPASKWPEQVAGVTASPVTQMIYVAARGFFCDETPATEKKV